MLFFQVWLLLNFSKLIFWNKVKILMCQMIPISEVFVNLNFLFVISVAMYMLYIWRERFWRIGLYNFGGWKILKCCQKFRKFRKKTQTQCKLGALRPDCKWDLGLQCYNAACTAARWWLFILQWLDVTLDFHRNKAFLKSGYLVWILRNSLSFDF